ncbi:hypothetical protein ACFSJU_19490 [Paradesertivirga mongoliensis]|uniref:Alginate export domain-containing protein n=1 Tax=Paradesertivirga mongoliensis TaxID=2100740 RepID=A0ABW4ZR32_9SPHI|nr:hypothetical protein [Pedobacter mongoliensis]
MRSLFLIVFLNAAFLLSAIAQHDHDHDHEPAKKPAKAVKPATKDTSKTAAKPSPAKAPVQQGGHNHPPAATNGSEHNHSSGHVNTAMSHAFSRSLPMTRNGSGTSWQPDNSPMYGYMFHKKDWMYMLHGEAYVRYNKQDLTNKGSRGDSKFDAPNMVMLMGQRNTGKKGLFHFNIMLSLDPITVGGEGYPLLFQTGETYKGQPLVDRQHPHDFISELSASYAHSFSRKADVFLYLGYPGEPALGPTAYVHRPSGFFNPDAPLTHHWVDATHITFGVATLGFRYNNWKIEGSSFTGREPGENRYDFDKPRFDSWSLRLSHNPGPKWATQVSHGFIKEPESLHPGENVNRTTASATFSTRGAGEEFINLTALWGMNKTAHHAAEHGALVEGSYNVRKTTVYGRYEWVQKSLEELSLDEDVFGHDVIFPVNAFTAGGSYDILLLGKTKIALGTQLSVFKPDDRLSALYGKTPVSGQIYLRIYPRAMGVSSGKFYAPY